MRRKNRNLDELLDELAQAAADDPIRKLDFATASLISDIADKVYAMRTERDYTQERLAELVGMSQPAIAILENPGIDREPMLSTLIKVALGLGKKLVIDFEDVGEATTSGPAGPLVAPAIDDRSRRRPGFEA